MSDGSEDGGGGFDVLDGLFPGISDRVESAQEQAKIATKSALINRIPGAGVLFTHDLDAGFRLTTLGTWAALGLGAYGLARLVGGR